MGFSDPILTGSGNLIRVTEQSDNFIHGSAGWQLTRDGNFEANNGTFRGTITASTFDGTDFVINTSGAFFYSGTPAAGNLIASIAPALGSDGFGNAYQAGIAVYNSTFISCVDNVNNSALDLEASSGLQAITIAVGGSYNSGSINSHQADGILHIDGPQLTTDTGAGTHIVMSPASPANGGNAKVAVTADQFTWNGQNVLAVGAWTALTLGSSWQDGNSVTQGMAPAYRMVGKNRVELRGTIQPNPAGNLASPSIVTGALPAGARPPSGKLLYFCVGTNLTSTTILGRLRIDSSGDIQFNFLGATAPAAFALDGVQFDIS